MFSVKLEREIFKEVKGTEKNLMLGNSLYVIIVIFYVCILKNDVFV